MTDRVHSFIVILENDMREDDAEHTLNALRMVKGVIKVEPVISGPEEHMAYARARFDLTKRIYEALSDKT